MSRRLAIAMCVAVVASFSVNAGLAADAKRAKKKTIVQESSEHAYGTAGCGLGSIVFHDKEGFIQVIAATFNWYGGQTFAISTGTSNCDKAERSESAALFIEGNKVAFQNDVARGNGETLVAFSKLIGCENSDQLGKTLQKRYGEIYSGPASSVAVRDSIMKTITTDQALFATCSSSG